MPFCLTFDTEVVISVKIGEPSPQTTLFQPTENEDEIRVPRSKLAPRQFQPNDLVLRRITRTVESNKLTLIWEGPFRIIGETTA
ncbi:hypothetical protein CR513_15276, partial [Mucuna pruriens]